MFDDDCLKSVSIRNAPNYGGAGLFAEKSSDKGDVVFVEGNDDIFFDFFLDLLHPRTTTCPSLGGFVQSIENRKFIRGCDHCGIIIRNIKFQLLVR
jgi:hypothetical protein